MLMSCFRNENIILHPAIMHSAVQTMLSSPSWVCITTSALPRAIQRRVNALCRTVIIGTVAKNTWRTTKPIRLHSITAFSAKLSWLKACIVAKLNGFCTLAFVLGALFGFAVISNPFDDIGAD